jgi:hypothetical protein
MKTDRCFGILGGGVEYSVFPKGRDLRLETALIYWAGYPCSRYHGFTTILLAIFRMF